MSIIAVKSAVEKEVKQRNGGLFGSAAVALVRSLEGVWPTIESSASLVSDLSGLAILISIGEEIVFREHEPANSVNIVVQRTVEVSAIGDIHIFYLRYSDEIEQSEDFGGVQQLDFQALEAAAFVGRNAPALRGRDLKVVNILSRMIEVIIDSTINFNIRAIGMTHELTMVLQGTSGLLSDLLEEAREAGKQGCLPPEFSEDVDIVEAENECALHVLRNFLSDAGYLTYKEATKQKLAKVDLSPVIDRLIKIYSRIERGRLLKYDNRMSNRCPVVFGDKDELERLLHNIFANAVKYSFLPTGEVAERSIRIFAQVPFSEKRGGKASWALCVQNYGVGLAAEEAPYALRPGFRGRHARKQVAVGAGIGLSEAQKIMSLHGGRVRIRSDFQHAGRTGDVYLTTVTLIFPLLEGHHAANSMD